MKIINIHKCNDSLHYLVVNDDELGLIIDALSYASDYSLASLRESKNFSNFLSILDEYVSKTNNDIK